MVWPTLMWKHQWSDMKWPPPRCHLIFKSHISHCLPGVFHHHLASFTNCVIPRLSHPRTRLHFLYFPSYFIRCYQLKFSISNLWSANNIINQRPVPDSKKFKIHWPRQSIHARTILVRDVQWRGWSGLAVGPWDIIHDLHLRVPRAPHWVNPALLKVNWWKYWDLRNNEIPRDWSWNKKTDYESFWNLNRNNKFLCCIAFAVLGRWQCSVCSLVCFLSCWSSADVSFGP